jgi:hypothetical protein
VILVKRAQPDQVRSVAIELDTSRFGQAPYRNFLLDPLDLGFRNSRHRISSRLRQ